jgi:hypothetical protein
MTHTAALPFTLKKSDDTFSGSGMTTTTETVHGLLFLDAERLVIQWRRARKTDHIGLEMRSDEEVEAVREIVIPLSGLAGAALRRRWWESLFAPRLVLTASDLRAFEDVAGPHGLGLGHPAELVLKLRRADALAGAEFAAELELAMAELQAGSSRALSQHESGQLAAPEAGVLPKLREDQDTS